MGGQKEKEDLEEISTELELADEDEKVPYVAIMALRWSGDCVANVAQIQDW